MAASVAEPDFGPHHLRRPFRGAHRALADPDPHPQVQWQAGSSQAREPRAQTGGDRRPPRRPRHRPSAARRPRPRRRRLGFHRQHPGQRGLHRDRRHGPVRAPRARRQHAGSRHAGVQLDLGLHELSPRAGRIRRHPLPRRIGRRRALGARIHADRARRPEERRLRGAASDRRRRIARDRGLSALLRPPARKRAHRADRAGDVDGELSRLRQRQSGRDLSRRPAAHRPRADAAAERPSAEQEGGIRARHLFHLSGRLGRKHLVGAPPDPQHAAEILAPVLALGLAVQRRSPLGRLAGGDGLRGRHPHRGGRASGRRRACSASTAWC